MASQYLVRAINETQMSQIELACEDIIGVAGVFKDSVTVEIASAVPSDVRSEEMLRIKNNWADIGLELKTSVSISRIVVEIYTHAFETD